jgi:GR25 family glycosyltransferase involved in LPS biosynthesis
MDSSIMTAALHGPGLGSRPRRQKPVAFFADAMRAHLPILDLDLKQTAEIGPSGLPTPLVISLARRPDRWARAKEALARIEASAPLRVDAIDGQTLGVDVLSAFLEEPDEIDAPLEEYLRPTKPAVGCFLSHLAVWQRFIQSDAPIALIVEDDVLPSPDFSPTLARRLLADLPPDADMLLLGYTIMDGLAEKTASSCFRRIYYYNGTFAYLLTRKGCHNLLSRLLPIRTHIDNQISLELVTDRSLRVYGAEPRLFSHDFTVWSDVYVPISDTTRADRALATMFDDARAALTANGARLMEKFVPAA